MRSPGYLLAGWSSESRQDDTRSIQIHRSRMGRWLMGVMKIITAGFIAQIVKLVVVVSRRSRNKSNNRSRTAITKNPNTRNRSSIGRSDSNSSDPIVVTDPIVTSNATVSTDPAVATQPLGVGDPVVAIDPVARG